MTGVSVDAGFAVWGKRVELLVEAVPKVRTLLYVGSQMGFDDAGGKAMQIAAAQPDIPWTDLAYALTPNGHTLDYVTDAPYLARGASAS